MNDLEERLKARVEENLSTGCIEWTGPRLPKGYGRTSYKGQQMYAHRLAYYLAHPDEDITNKSVCHTCDNPSCVNPDHLYAGTQAENMRDKMERGRWGAKRGRRTRRRVIATNLNNFSRREYKNQAACARDLGVSEMAISLALDGTTKKVAGEWVLVLDSVQPEPTPVRVNKGRRKKMKLTHIKSGAQYVFKTAKQASQFLGMGPSAAESAARKNRLVCKKQYRAEWE